MLRTRPPSRTTRLSVEPLEDRSTPATLVGLTTNNALITFDSAAPTRILRSVQVTGVAAGEDLVSIDARPANGQLYGLTNKNTLYTVSLATGKATRVGTGPAAFLPTGGSRFGIEFNPNVDRLRAVNNADQNYRLNPANGAVVDGDPVTAGTQPDTPLAFATTDSNAGKNPNVIEVAYDRNFQGTGLTTLFGIDTNLDALVTVGGIDGTPSPNGGQLSTIGALGVAAGGRVGFDVAADGTAYASLVSMNGLGTSRLYTVNLMTGQATSVGSIGNGSIFLDGLTALPREEVVYGVTLSNRLVSFKASDPGKLLSALPLRSLIAGESVTGLDGRPSSGGAVGLTSLNRVLQVNTVTGETTQVGAQIDPALFATGPSNGFDFNPAADRLRLVNPANGNLRFNPLTFAPVDGDAATAGIQSDGTLTFIATDPNAGADPNVIAAAYDRNDNDPATATTLFVIDSTLNILARQGAVDGNAADVAGGGSPNRGLLTTLGSLGVDPTSLVGFDIIDAGSGGSGAALAVMQLEGETVSKLFQINLGPATPNQPTGTATLIGTVGGGEVLSAMAIGPPTIQFAAPVFRVVEGAGKATITLTRKGGTGSVASVRFDTLDGTAFGGVDYTEVLNNVVTFQRGETQKTVTIPILNDAVREPTETVHLTLAQATGGNAVLGLDAVSVLNILNDDR